MLNPFSHRCIHIKLSLNQSSFLSLIFAHLTPTFQSYFLSLFFAHLTATLPPPLTLSVTPLLLPIVPLNFPPFLPYSNALSHAPSASHCCCCEVRPATIMPRKFKSKMKRPMNRKANEEEGTDRLQGQLPH